MPFLATLFGGLAGMLFKSVDFTKIAIIVVKILVIGVVFAIIISFMSTFSGMIGSALGSMFSSTGTLGSLNLGYVAGAVGADTFVNNVLASVYIAGSFYISSMVGILIFQYSIKIYDMVVKV